MSMIYDQNKKSYRNCTGVSLGFINPAHLFGAYVLDSYLKRSKVKFGTFMAKSTKIDT